MTDYVKHPLIKEKTLESRAYQEDILAKAQEDNLMAVLPTGLGKTPIAVLLSVNRLDKFPESKILMLAPTKPLASQHKKMFHQFLDLDQKQFQVVTGEIKPEDREEVYKNNQLIFATPQTIQNDLKQDRFSFKNFSLLVIDEIHHGVGKYAYPELAQNYLETADNPRILGLTASPAGDREKIETVCSNCGIDQVEIKTETDPDVAPYVKEKKIQWLKVELPESFEKVRDQLKQAYQQKIKSLKRMEFLNKKKVYKKHLLQLQKKLGKAAREGYKKAYSGLSLTAQAIKLEHALTLLETQGITPLEKYFEKLRRDEKGRKLLKNKKVSNAVFLTRKLFQSDARHPKISRLCTEVDSCLQENPEAKIIVFANYRKTVREIVSVLEKVPGARPVAFVGQREGLTQKEQIERLKQFREGEYNVIVGTSISEEGLDIPSMDLAIFYEPVPSEIRSIQRRGRVGRQKAGKIIILITKDTRDEAYYWSAKHKEKKMKRTLYGMKDSSKEKETKTDKESDLKRFLD